MGGGTPGPQHPAERGGDREAGGPRVRCIAGPHVGVVSLDAAVGRKQGLRVGSGGHSRHQGHLCPQRCGAHAGEAPAEGRGARSRPPLPLRRAAGRMGGASSRSARLGAHARAP
eukprot:4991029-Pleurochrysis_carterae.AAC.1